MSAKATHPAYDAMLEAWTIVADAYQGELAIKAKTTDYLPPTSGQIEDGALGADPKASGALDYAAYLLRATYPDLYRESIRDLVGTMHEKPPHIELPAAMESLRERATSTGESLADLLRRINVQQLGPGRVSILGDLRTIGGEDRPVVSVYTARAVRSWNVVSQDGELERLTFAMLDESGHEMAVDFTWQPVTRYRVVALTTMIEGTPVYDPLGEVYATAELREDQSIDDAEFVAPGSMGRTIDTIPFQFINANDIVAEPGQPPLLGLALLCLSIYRGEADYEQNLHMQSQDTLVEIGHGHPAIGSDGAPVEEEPRRTGAGARIKVPDGGDAKYIGVSSAGLSEQRTALENKYTRAAQRGGQLIDATSKAKESGDALRLRIAAQTTGLQLIARAGAAGLQNVLRAMAPWFGANPDEVVIQPNQDFTVNVIDGRTAVDLATAKGLGYPISDEELHAWGLENGATTLSYEETVAAMARDRPSFAPAPPDDPGEV